MDAPRTYITTMGEMRVVTNDANTPITPPPAWPPVVRVDVLTNSELPKLAVPIKLGETDSITDFVAQAWNDPESYFHATNDENEITVTPGTIVVVVDDGTFHRIPKIEGATIKQVSGSKQGHGAKRATYKRKITITKWAKQLQYVLSVAFSKCQYLLLSPSTPETPINWTISPSTIQNLLPVTAEADDDDDDNEAVYEYASLVLLNSLTLTETVDPFLCQYLPPEATTELITEDDLKLAVVDQVPKAVAASILHSQNFRILRVLSHHQEWLYVKRGDDAITTYVIN